MSATARLLLAIDICRRSDVLAQAADALVREDHQVIGTMKARAGR